MSYQERAAKQTEILTVPYHAISSLVRRLSTAGSFEEAAGAMHRAMLACAQSALAASSYASSARLLRSVVHLRPEGRYQHIFGIKYPDGEPVEGVGYLSSANVWRWVEEHCCSVSIDLKVNRLRVWLSDCSLEHVDAVSADAAGAPGDDSRVRMLGRNGTHIHVVPLRVPGGAVHGMIVIEARCKAALGKDFIWEACHEQLEVLASIAAPYLRALPPTRTAQAAQKELSDTLLPVVGCTTAGIIKLLRVFARQQETILISGPTGSGKSRLARWCHHQSLRKQAPFETLDLLSVPEDLQMAELFGWKRGAFTGAIRSNPGALARAAGGTLFIDEIDKLSLKAQAGLLRVLEEQRFRPLGDDGDEQRADVRFLIGTNADLRAVVQQGRFREDLYYRIHVLPVRLPPLAERLDELPQWAEYMLQRRHASQGAKSNASLTTDAVKLLLGQPWPGNLRQLDNLIRRSYVFALADRRSAEGALILQRQHVARALSFEAHGADGSERATPIALLWQAARAYVRQAERHCGEGLLTLDRCAGFGGLVLGAAVQRLGSRERAFKLLGEPRLLNNRNHHRVYRREMKRARALMETLGGKLAPELAELFAVAGGKAKQD